jgi:hypothetical protein
MVLMDSTPLPKEVKQITIPAIQTVVLVSGYKMQGDAWSFAIPPQAMA